MTTHEVIKKLIGQWVERAEDDFLAAGALLQHETLALVSIAFHSQQCAEKYLKAFLTARQIEFPKTHNIKKLLGLVAPADPSLADLLADADGLSPYGVEIRYPGDFPDMWPERAKKAFDLASKVRDAMRESLSDWLRNTEEASDEKETP